MLEDEGKKSYRMFDDEYYSLPPVEEPSVVVTDEVEIKRFGVVDRIVGFIGIYSPPSILFSF